LGLNQITVALIKTYKSIKHMPPGERSEGPPPLPEKPTGDEFDDLIEGRPTIPTDATLEQQRLEQIREETDSSLKALKRDTAPSDHADDTPSLPELVAAGEKTLTEKAAAQPTKGESLKTDFAGEAEALAREDMKEIPPEIADQEVEKLAAVGAQVVDQAPPVPGKTVELADADMEEVGAEGTFLSEKAKDVAASQAKQVVDQAPPIPGTIEHAKQQPDISAEEAIEELVRDAGVEPAKSEKAKAEEAAAKEVERLEALREQTDRSLKQLEADKFAQESENATEAAAEGVTEVSDEEVEFEDDEEQLGKTA
jgi:hypothetical protein